MNHTLTQHPLQNAEQAEPFSKERQNNEYAISPAQQRPSTSEKNAETPTEKPQISIKLPVKTLLFIGLIGILIGAGFYLYRHQPPFLKDLMLKVDVFSVSNASKNEQQRINTIQKLPITYEEKQVLIGRTVFLGASPTMVLLALGEPKSRQKKRLQNGTDRLAFLYHLDDNTAPTLLIFSQNKLTEAKRASAIDIGF